MQVIAGFSAGDPTLLGVGRAVLVRQPGVSPARLAGYALQAGFGFVHHRTADPGGPAVYMAAYTGAGPPPSLLSNADPAAPSMEVAQNALVELSVRPLLATKGRLDWSAEAVCPAAAALSTALLDAADPPGTTRQILQGTAAGAVAAIATVSIDDYAKPYQFAVVPGTDSPLLSKDQYRRPA